MITLMEHIRRRMRTTPTIGEASVRVILAVLAPTLLRWALLGNLYGSPFVLYFPVILLIAVLLGWRAGVVTATGSCIVAVCLFWPASFLVVGGQQVAVIVMFALSAATMIAIGQLLRDALLEIDTRARQSEDFNRELQHRTKNSIQMMRALASQASKATDPAEFYATLGGRLAALAKANELLRFGALETCDMDTLMKAAIAPFNSRQFSLGGPVCCVSRNGCTPLMMALHELGTNASKYGALSIERGKVEIGWRVAETDSAVEVRWRETGGPAVSEPTRKGIGARLLAPNGALRAVTVHYLPDGVVCEMTVEQG
jgi:two-component sensor histidine kinase